MELHTASLLSVFVSVAGDVSVDVTGVSIGVTVNKCDAPSLEC